MIKNNSSHPFLDPLWRRILLIVAIAAWALTELYFESYTWATIVGVFTVYGAWSYLINYVPSTQLVAKTVAEASDTSEK